MPWTYITTRPGIPPPKPTKLYTPSHGIMMIISGSHRLTTQEERGRKASRLYALIPVHDTFIITFWGGGGYCVNRKKPKNSAHTFDRSWVEEVSGFDIRPYADSYFYHLPKHSVKFLSCQGVKAYPLFFTSFMRVLSKTKQINPKSSTTRMVLDGQKAQ